MSWTVTAKSTHGDFTGTTATTVTLTASVPAGDGVVLFLENGNVVTYTVSDSAGGNTYTATDTNIANSSGQGLSAWYSTSLTNAVTSFTITASGGTLAFYVLAAIQFTNSAGAGVTFHDHHSATGNSAAPSSGAAAFTSGDLTIGGVCTGTTPQTINAGTNYTIVNQAGTTFDYADADGTANGTALFSVTTADFWSCLALTFSPPGATLLGQICL